MILGQTVIDLWDCLILWRTNDGTTTDWGYDNRRKHQIAFRLKTVRGRPSIFVDWNGEVIGIRAWAIGAHIPRLPTSYLIPKTWSQKVPLSNYSQTVRDRWEPSIRARLRTQLCTDAMNNEIAKSTTDVKQNMWAYLWYRLSDGLCLITILTMAFFYSTLFALCILCRSDVQMWCRLQVWSRVQMRWNV